MALLALNNNINIHTPILGHCVNTYNYTDIEKQYYKFNQMFIVIGSLQEGDKLARNDERVYYIHNKNMYFLQLRRWWNNQGRNFTFNHLDEDFLKFMEYLDTILGSLEKNYDYKIRELALLVQNLGNRIMTGLYNLKKTYPGEAKLLCKIDSIILSIIDFKDTLNSILEKFKYRSNTIIRQRALSD